VAGRLPKILRCRAGVCVNTGTIPSKTMREAVLHLSGFYSKHYFGANHSTRESVTMAEDHRVAFDPSHLPAPSEAPASVPVMPEGAQARGPSACRRFIGRPAGTRVIPRRHYGQMNEHAYAASPILVARHIL
jgi:hypothetical protein